MKETTQVFSGFLDVLIPHPSIRVCMTWDLSLVNLLTL